MPPTDTQPPVAPPVFVDDTGRRHRAVRVAGYLLAVVTLGYLALMALSLIGSPDVAPLSLPGLGRLFPGPIAPSIVVSGRARAPGDVVANVTPPTQGPRALDGTATGTGTGTLGSSLVPSPAALPTLAPQPGAPSSATSGTSASASTAPAAPVQTVPPTTASTSPVNAAPSHPVSSPTAQPTPRGTGSPTSRPTAHSRSQPATPAG